MKKGIILILLLTSMIISGCKEEDIYMFNLNGGGIARDDCPPGSICYSFTYTSGIAYFNTTDYDNTNITFRYE